MKNVLIFLCLILILPAKSFGFHKSLNDSLVEEAIEYGVAHKKTEVLKFFEPWQFKKGWEGCLVWTKWCALASSARDATRKYQLVDSNLIAETKSDSLLMFNFFLLGNRISFAKNVHSVIKIDTLILQPVYKRNEHLASTSGFWPDDPAYHAVCQHYYHLADIPPDAKIELIVIKGSGKEIIFKIDLSKIK